MYKHDVYSIFSLMDGKKKIKERERKKTILYIANSLIARRRVGHYVPLRFG